MVPYSFLLGVGHDNDGRIIEIVEERLRSIIRIALESVEIDEAWYLSVNGDVGHAVKSGVFSSARDHYVSSGYFEDRLPRPVVVDEAWYLSTYTDVADAIKRGKFETAQQHFNIAGFKEGRRPTANWDLRSEKKDGKVQKLPLRA
jgi:hypothetical protein